MNHKLIEVYNHYKRLYPGALVMFHLGGDYVMLFNDADRLSTCFSNHNWFRKFSGGAKIPESMLLDFMSTAGRQGYSCLTVDYRNHTGELDYPDIAKLNQEMADDY